MNHPAKHDSAPVADWYSIAFHAFIGILMGAVMGFLVISGDMDRWREGELILPFLSGSALAGAGLVSTLGVSLHFGKSCDNEHDIEAVPPSHSRSSRRLCLLSLVAGLSLAGISLYLHYCV